MISDSSYVLQTASCISVPDSLSLVALKEPEKPVGLSSTRGNWQGHPIEKI